MKEEIPRKFEEIKERNLIGITTDFSLIGKLNSNNLNISENLNS